MEIQLINPEELKPSEYNPRKISAKELDKLKKSIWEFGFVEPIIINKNKTVIGGHQRLKVAMTAGLALVPCVEVDLPKNKEMALNLALNRISGGWDNDLLVDALNELTMDESIDELITGFDQDEIQKLLDGQLDLSDNKDEGKGSGGGEGRECPNCGHLF